MPGDVLHFAAAQLAPPIFQLLLKLSMRLQEPLQWKGGELHHVWKKKQSALLCHSYRAILVSSTIGKSVHSVFRQRCGQYLDNAATPLQIGGRRGFPVQLAMHAARLFHEAMRRRNLPSATVFLDLSEAFHRVARPLVHGGDLCPEHVSSIVAALGLHPDVVPRLQTYVTQQSLLIKAGASTWTGQVLQEFSQDSWFVHGSLEGTAIVRSGTRPGDNLADMVFSFLFAEILHSLRRQFRQAGLRLSLPWREDWLCAPPLEVSEAASQNSVSPLDITWMDDLALLVTAERACDLPAKVAAVATTTITECVQATLLPNLAQGKTEAVLSLRGPGSQAVRADLFRGSEPSIELHSDIWPAARLRVVPKYRHVGGILEAGGGLKKELKSRIGSAWSAFRQHKRQVFMSPVVTHREKAVLFASLIESTLYYGVGTWPNIEAPVVAKFQGALVGMARLMLRPTYSIEAARHLSADLCLAIARILPAANAMRIERLRHFATTVRNANAELWALLHYERGWLQHVQTDITWMGQQLELAGHSSSEVSTWERAIETIRGRPRRWKHLVRLSRDTALLQAHWAAEKQQFYGLLCRQLARLALQTGRDNLPWKSVEFARRSSLTCVPGRTMPLRYTKGFARNDFLSVANNARFVFDILPTPRSCAITCVTHLRASQLSCWKVVLVSHSPVLAADDLTMARRLNCLRYRRKDPSARGGQGKLSRRNTDLTRRLSWHLKTFFAKRIPCTGIWRSSSGLIVKPSRRRASRPADCRPLPKPGTVPSRISCAMMRK